MFNFTHEVQDLNLIITSLEHKIRDMQLLVQKLTKQATAQVPVTTPVAETETAPEITTNS